MSFESQRVVVVGASAGIGEATARAFAAAGAEVVIAGRAKDRLEEARERIGFPVETYQLDATDADAVAAFFDGLTQISHLVLTASPGAVGAGPFAALAESALRAAFDGKFYAHVKVLQAAAPKMRQDGSITLVSAISARMAVAGSAALAAVNGALEAMARPLAVELAPVRVNAVSPGIIDTHWWDVLPEPQRAATFQAAADSSPVGRVGKPEDVADAVLFLAGQGFMTGTVLEVAGGAHLPTGR
jgi:NAD(P)-dependent dehydrogenase (short-subunit alcohol dehydrogenase family)